MSQFEDELSQCRSLLRLALARLDVLESLLPQSLKSDYDKESFLSQSQKSEYDEKKHSSQSQISERDEKDFSSQSQISEYDKEVSSSQSQESERDNLLSLSQSRSDQSVGTFSSAPTPDALYAVLRVGVLKGMPRRSIRAASRLLLHLHAAPGGRHGYRTLTGVTKLSERSLVVHMAALRRRGLLEKTGFQTYALTEAALGAMAEAAVGK